jgi:hypothetical protein
MRRDDGCRYKTVALCHLAYIYLRPIFAGVEAVDHISMLMIVFGYLVSMAATHALGVDGTYFAIELGFLEADYNFVKAFPCVALKSLPTLCPADRALKRRCGRPRS